MEESAHPREFFPDLRTPYQGLPYQWILEWRAGIDNWFATVRYRLTVVGNSSWAVEDCADFRRQGITGEWLL
jgi:hypothetical protein